MCYSAMVLQDAKKLGIRFHARVQTELYDHLFKARLAGEKLYINKGMEQTFLAKPENAKEKVIAESIKKWHTDQISEIEEALFAQKKRLADANRVLETKTTKKAENDKRIATDKIEKFSRDLEKHRNLKADSDSDSRIFPLHYLSMVTLDEKGEKVVMPIRYLMRPANKDEAFDRDYNGCYNARLDSIDRVPWWKNVLGKRHGVILVKKFYENVPCEIYQKNHKLNGDAKDKKTIVLCFEPDDVDYMVIPMLWDVWKKAKEILYSGALITDDPAPEIAEAGHDRTPIFLKESVVDAWLNCEGKSTQEIKAILNERETPYYSHKVMGAA